MSGGKPGRHSAAWQNNLFCARVPCRSKRGGGKCPAETQQNYVEVCRPTWYDFTFPRGAKPNEYQAHHLLCWACVTSAFFFKHESKYKLLARGTKWCVNNPKNMLALPMWGHTFKYYKSSSNEPPFSNWPQHDIDHNTGDGYTDEVEQAINKVLREVKQQGHDVENEDISAELDNLSSDFRTKLTNRGQRGTMDVQTGQLYVGTHACFKYGKDDWYLPFSMAKRPTHRVFSGNAFPAIDKAGLAARIARA